MRCFIVSLVSFCIFKASFGISRNHMPDQSSTLLGAFGAQCSFHGNFSKQASVHTEVLKGILHAVIDDDECRAWGQEIQGSMDSIGYPTNNNVKVEQIHDEITSLEDALLLETNVDSINILGLALGERKVDLAATEHATGRDNLLARQEFLSRLAQFSAAVSSSLSSNPRCFARYPGVALQLGGQVLAQSQGLNYYSGLAGALLTVVGRTFDMILNAIRSAKYDKILAKLERNSMIDGLICAFESMARNYCEAEIMINRFTYTATHDVSIHNKKWLGLRLISTLPIYNLWISQILAGSPPADVAAAIRKEIGLNLRSNLQKSEERLRGALAEAESKLDVATDATDAEKMDIRAQAINTLIEIILNMRTNPLSDPYANFFARDPACGPRSFFYTGIPITDNPSPFVVSCENYYRNRPEGVPVLAVISVRINTLIAKALTYVDREFFRVKETDPLNLLAKAETRTRGDLNSPIDFLRNIVIYINDLEQESASALSSLPKVKLLLTETRSLVEKALETYYKSSENDEQTAVQVSMQTVKEIQAILSPMDNSSFLRQRLTTIINWHFRFRLENGTFSKDIKELLYLSIKDNISTLEDLTKIDLEAARADARLSQMSTIKNLKALGDIFKKTLKSILKELHKEHLKMPHEKSFKSAINNLCIVTLAIPDYENYRPDEKKRSHFGHFVNNVKMSKKINLLKYCKGVKLESLYNTTGANIIANYDELYKSSVNSRICGYFDFSRRNNLYRLIRKLYHDEETSRILRLSDSDDVNPLMSSHLSKNKTKIFSSFRSRTIPTST